jgi:hypothetical protein
MPTIEKTRRVPEAKCLACGMLVNAATSLNTDFDPNDPCDTPKIMICLACGHVQALTDDMQMRKLTDAEMVLIAGDPVILAAQKARGESQLPRLHRLIKELAEMVGGLFEDVGEMPAIFVMEDGEPDTSRKLIKVPTFLGKDEAFTVLRKCAREVKAVRCVYITEAWLLKTEGSLLPEMKEHLSKVGIADHPHRIEAVIFNGEDQETGSLIAQRNIMRPAIGKPYLAPLEFFSDHDHAEGRLHEGFLARKRGASR